MGARKEPSRNRVIVPVRQNRARICKPFKEPRNRFPASWNRFLGFLNVYKFGMASKAGGIDSLELIPGPFKRFTNSGSYLRESVSLISDPGSEVLHLKFMDLDLHELRSTLYHVHFKPSILSTVIFDTVIILWTRGNV